MKEQGLTCTKFNHKNRKYSSYKGTIGKVSNNLLKRRFNTDRPFQKIVTDITELSYLTTLSCIFLRSWIYITLKF